MDFRGERRTNAGHASTTDPEARPTTRRITLGGDKNYDTHQFVQDLRAVQVMPHVTQHTTNRASAIDGRTTRHLGYAISQQKRKRVEEIFGCLKTVALLHKVNLRGGQRVGWLFTFAAARVQPGADAPSCGGCDMSRHGPTVRTVAHSGPPRCAATRHRWASRLLLTDLRALRSLSLRVFPQPAKRGEHAAGGLFLNGMDSPGTMVRTDHYQKEGVHMTHITRMGIDVAKPVFQLHGVNDRGQTVLRRRVSRIRLRQVFAQLPPCLVGMEACGSAHYWARELRMLGHDCS